MKPKRNAPIPISVHGWRGNQPPLPQNYYLNGLSEASQQVRRRNRIKLVLIGTVVTLFGIAFWLVQHYMPGPW